MALTLVGVAAVRVEHGGRGCSRGSQVPRGLGPVGAHQPSERELSNKQLGRSLVLANLAQRHRPRSARARQGLLTGGGGALHGQSRRTGSDAACVVWQRRQQQLLMARLRRGTGKASRRVPGGVHKAGA